MKTNIHFVSYLAQFFLEREMFQTKVVEKIKTHILCSVTFSRKSYRLWDNVGKYSTDVAATDDSMGYAYFTLDMRKLSVNTPSKRNCEGSESTVCPKT